jgi:8-oxo-dGTP diphosphatase
MKVVVKGLIFKDNKLLIMKRSINDKIGPGLWEIPGGSVEFGEDPVDALIREIKEETNYFVKILRPVHTWSFTSENNHWIGINFLCEIISGDILLSKEHDDYKFVSTNEVKNIVKFKNVIDSLEAILK